MTDFSQVGTGYPENMTMETIENTYSASQDDWNNVLNDSSFFKYPENIVSMQKSKVRRSLENVVRGFAEQTYKTATATNFKDNYNLFRGVVKVALSDNEEEQTAGQLLVKTARDNIEANNRRIANNFFVSEKDKESFSRTLGQGASDLAVQIGVGLSLGVPAAISLMGTQEFTGELQTRLEKANNISEYTKEKAQKDILGSGLYTTGSMILEHRLGLDNLINKVFKPAVLSGKRTAGQVAKAIAKKGIAGAVSEGTTEFLQADLSTLLRLADKTITWEDIPEELINNVKEGVAGAILGGTSSVGFAIHNRAKMIETIERTMGETLSDGGKNDVHEQATILADNMLDSGMTALTREIVANSQLGNKQGEIYESLQSAIGKAIEGKVEFENEADKQRYISDNAWRVADWTLAEAVMRNQPITDILNPDDIYFDGKGIRLKSKTPSEELAEGISLNKIGEEIPNSPIDIDTQHLTDQLEKGVELSDIAKETKNPTVATKALNSTQGNIEFNMTSLHDDFSNLYLSRIAHKHGFSENQFKALQDKVFEVADYINEQLKDVPEWKEWNAKEIKTFVDNTGIPMPIRSIFVKNGDYDFNIDLSTLCVKREFADMVIKKLVDLNLASQLTVSKLEQLKALLRKYEVDVACDVCFIEGKRINARGLSNGLAYEWQSVREALGIDDNYSIGTKREFTEEQNKLLDLMTDRRFLKDDNSIMSEEEYNKMTKDEKETFAKSHKMVFQKAFKDYMPIDRVRTVKGKTVQDKGITDAKMYSIAKIFKKFPEMAGEFNPDVLMNSEQTTALLETYYDDVVTSFMASYAGAGTPKLLLGYNPYNELSWRDKYDRNADKLNEMLFDIGGVRGQSFSDYNELLVIDYLQKYLAETLRHTPSHEYTKQASLVRTFGDIGVMYNMSLVPKIEKGVDKEHYGLRKATESEIKQGKTAEGFPIYTDEQGSWTYSFHEDSFPVNEALELRKKFNKTAGIIVVGVSELQIRMMLNDPQIDMVIPFHASGMPLHTKMMTGLINVDYSDVQTTKIHDKGKDYSYNKKLREIKDPRKTAEDYLNWCDKKHYTQKFPQFSNEKNYYKLLEDFRGYDNDGNAIIQGAVDISKTDWSRIKQEGVRGAKERTEKTSREMSAINSKEFMKEMQDIFKYQAVDTLTQNMFRINLTKLLGNENVFFGKQEDFFKELSKIQPNDIFRKNSDGQVYGFVDKGKVFINETCFNAHTPVHEFTHVWAKVVQQVNPDLWKEGKTLLKQSGVWEEVINDALYTEIKSDEDAVASEVLSRLAGNRSEDMINKLLDYHSKQHATAQNLSSRIITFLKNFFDVVRKTFVKGAEVDLTLDEFLAMPIQDFFDSKRHKAFKNALAKANLDGHSEFNMISTTYEPLTQRRKGKIKGSFNQTDYIIKLTNNADYSTLPHEFAHSFLQSMIDYINSGNASESYTKRFDDMMSEFRKSAYNKQGILNKEKTARDTQEYFARQYERYLLENKAETEAQKDIFNDFERWLKSVYSDVNIKGSTPLSQAQVDFFNSHITDTLPKPVNPIYKPEVERPQQEEKVNIQETKTPVESSPKTETVETPKQKFVYQEAREDIEGKISRVYARMNKDGYVLKFGRLSNEEQINKAVNLVENDIVAAKNMIDGEMPLDDDLLRTALMIAYENKMLDLGNIEEYNRVRRKHSLEQTRRGQEIQAEKIGQEDLINTSYWVNKAEDERATQLAHKLGLKLKNNYGEPISPKRALRNYIDGRIKSAMEKLNKGASVEDIANDIKNEFDFDGELYQSETYNNVYDFISNMYDKAMNLKIDDKTVEKINNQVNRLRDALQTVDISKRLPVETFDILNNLMKLYQSLNPSSNLAVLSSTIRRGLMLTAPATHILNIVSNIENGIEEMAVRRLKYKTKNLGYVDEKAIKDYNAYAKQVFDKSGLALSTTRPQDIRTPVYKGEKTVSAQGEGKIREVGRLLEDIIFKKALGYPDMLAKNFAFNDTASLLASKYIEDTHPEYTLEQKRTEATRLYEMATALEPSTDIAAEIRNKAIAEAEEATFTDKGWIAEKVSQLRNLINEASGDLKLGDWVAPFVATPANVVGLGLEASAGALYGVWNWKSIANDIRTGTISETTQNAITYAYRNGLGLLMALFISACLDDDDYIPPYEMTSLKDRDLAKLKNAPYNSVKFGNTYVSLDYFGPLSAPLTAILQAKRDADLYGYIKGIAMQTSAIPVIDKVVEGGNLIRNMADDPDRAVKELLESGKEGILATVVPNVWTVANNLFSSAEKETRERKTQAKLLPETLPNVQNIALGGEVERGIGRKLANLIGGGRIKVGVANAITQEFDRLNKTNNAPNMTDMIRARQFKELSIDERQSLNERFAEEYANKVDRLISSARYQRMDDKDKKEEINKIRAKIIERLKKTIK